MNIFSLKRIERRASSTITPAVSDLLAAVGNYHMILNI
jgi:hypothetical protein